MIRISYFELLSYLPSMLLCIGTTPTVQRTLVFEQFRLNEVNRATRCDEYASGKSINVARVARLLGSNVLATGFIGGDRGKFLLGQLAEEGIGHQFIKVSPQTRLCTTLLDSSSGTVTELVEESARVEPEAWVKLYRLCLRRRDTTSACVLSGSLPPGGNLEFYADIVAGCAEKKIPVIVDTRGPALLRALRSRRFIAKLNREEIAMTLGKPVRTDAALKLAMRKLCPADGSIVVTLGKEGAVALENEIFWHIPAPKVKTINPIGSGDSFAAGLAVGLARKLLLKECYALASACGAANAMTSRAGVVDAAIVEKLRLHVRVTHW